MTSRSDCECVVITGTWPHGLITRRSERCFTAFPLLSVYPSRKLSVILCEIMLPFYT